MSKKNDFENYLKVSSEEINNHKSLVLENMQKKIASQTPILLPAFGLYVKGNSGGKGIRGTLVKLGSEIGGTFSNNEIIKVSAAVEIMHTSLLIHDDIIDKSPIRRGRESLHKALGNDHYATSQSICLSDLGFFISLKIISESDFPPVLKSRVLSIFASLVSDTIIGEMLDVEFSSSANFSLKEKDVFTIQSLKTARYTITAPLIIGAILGGAKEHQLKPIKLFGEYLGIAFQIQDDILGVFGNRKIVGKSVTSDIEEAKNTLLIIHALKHANPKQKKFLKNYYGKKNITLQTHTEIKRIFEDTESLAYSKQKFDEYCLKAQKLIPTISKNVSMQRLLSGFIEYLAKRQI